MEREGSNNNKQQELKKGPWKPEEDLLLTRYIELHGEGKWATVSKRSGLMRGGKSCRLRWKNYLRPNLKRGEMSKEEEDLIIRMHKLLGNRWSLIAGRLPGRTDNEVKNYWNTHLSKKYSQGQSETDFKTNLKKRKLSNPSEQQPGSCRKRGGGAHHHHQIASNGLTEGNFVVTNTTTTTTTSSKLDEGSEDLLMGNVATESTCDADDMKSCYYDQLPQLLPTNNNNNRRLFYDDPFLPSLDSTFSVDPFGHGVKYWTDLPIYSPESIYQILL